MDLLDPYGLPPATPRERPAGDEESIETPEHAEEEDLAREAPEVETVEPGPGVAGDDLDPAMRLQDAPSTWLGGADAPPEPEQDSDVAPAEPFAPLTDSGGQGI